MTCVAICCRCVGGIVYCTLLTTLLMSYAELIPNDIYVAAAEAESDDTDIDYYSETDSEYELSAQEHWEESIKQVTGLVHYVMFPLLGKFLGRRTAHVVWRRFAEWWF